MLTLQTILSLLFPQFVFAIELKDVFFSIPLTKADRQCLRVKAGLLSTDLHLYPLVYLLYQGYLQSV